jgi:hypothetical protein
MGVGFFLSEDFMATVLPTPMTELDAVNELLIAVGETKVNSLSDGTVYDAVMARSVLATTSRLTQSKGWSFNTEDNYPFAPDNSGIIDLPVNAMSAKFDPMINTDVDPIVRGQRLYDRLNHTYTFTRTLYGKLTLLLPFDQLPDAARQYITIAAARRFQDKMVGADELHQYTLRDEIDAKTAFLQEEASIKRRNILTSRTGARTGRYRPSSVLGGR